MTAINEDKTNSLHSGIKRSKSRNSKLHSREAMLIRRLKVYGWSDERIWKEYRIPLPAIQKAKKEMEGQAMKEFENKGQHAVELAMFKERLKFIIDSADLMAKDKNLSPDDRLNSERSKLEALAMLRDATEASISSPDPYSAVKKITEHGRSRRHNCNPDDK